MWYRLAKIIIKYRVLLLILLLVLTSVMGFYATQLQMSYEFSKAVPDDNPKYLEYQAFRNKFGDDGNAMVIGIEAKNFYSIDIFNPFAELQHQLRQINGVEDILSVPSAVQLIRNDSAQKFQSKKIFTAPYASPLLLDSDQHIFQNLPFYNGLLYNASSNATLMVVRLNKDSINSKSRIRLMHDITQQTEAFTTKTGIRLHVSGLPFIRTTIAQRVAKEMNWFLIGSLLLSAVTLLIFFRSGYATLMSLLVVGMGVICSMGTMVLLGYKVTLLTALVPPLIVVIGIPNCIYFLNKYHLSFRETGNKYHALIAMVGRMGVVTLFCNIAAAIGFAVFALTGSPLLKEFGIVAGINILLLFFISLAFIPSILSLMPEPKKSQVRYLDNKLLEGLLLRIERWTLNNSKWIYIVTVLVVIFSITGIFKLRSEGFIVDDLPKADIVYTDLKWFENNFNGIMPLEIMVDTKRKNGLTRGVETLEKMEAFTDFIEEQPETARPLSFLEGLKFARQAYYDGDSINYSVPSEFDMPLLAGYLKSKRTDSVKDGLGKILTSFMDSGKQVARISVNMKDIGSTRLPLLLSRFDSAANTIFDSSKYTVTFTGSSVTFLEGTRYIITGLKDSIFWAFILIAISMLFLFRSGRILLCSLIPNIIPLLVTAGVMGWLGIPLKPSTVLIFSVALGIVIDVTIRFLVNYRQEFPQHNFKVKPTIIQTIRHTGISIIYTSLVLVAGFIIFSFSHFAGTQALGWLTSLTLITGTLANLILLPVLMLALNNDAIVKK